MAKEVKDINKSFATVCTQCDYISCCPYEDRSQCIEVRSSSSNIEIDIYAEDNWKDTQESSNEDL